MSSVIDVPPRSTHLSSPRRGKYRARAMRRRRNRVAEHVAVAVAYAAGAVAAFAPSSPTGASPRRRPAPRGLGGGRRLCRRVGAVVGHRCRGRRSPGGSRQPAPGRCRARRARPRRVGGGQAAEHAGSSGDQRRHLDERAGVGRARGVLRADRDRGDRRRSAAVHRGHSPATPGDPSTRLRSGGSGRRDRCLSDRRVRRRRRRIALQAARADRTWRRLASARSTGATSPKPPISSSGPRARCGRPTSSSDDLGRSVRPWFPSSPSTVRRQSS